MTDKQRHVLIVLSYGVLVLFGGLLLGTASFTVAIFWVVTIGMAAILMTLAAILEAIYELRND